MKKKVVIAVSVVVGILVLCLIAVAVIARLNPNKTNLTFEQTGDSYTVTEYNGNDTEVVIPETYNGLPVTAIGDNAFKDVTNLKSVTIPNSIIIIGDNAFSGCTSLTIVIIGSGVTSIGNNAFDNTAYYNDEDNWVDDVLYIDSYLIKAKETLSGNYDIQQGTIAIADGAFKNCESLNGITISDSVIYIGVEAFCYCKSLTIVIIGSSVTSIGNSAFYECSSLRSITIPDSVTSIGLSVFKNCTSLLIVIFEDPTGWPFLGSITDPAQIATLLKGAYCDVVWIWGDASQHTHDYGAWIAEIPSTCSQAGTKGHYYCSSCHKYFDDTFTEITDLTIQINPNAHDYGQLIEKTEPNCINSGTEAHYQCTLCEKYFDEDHQEKSLESLTISASGHDYGQLIEKVQPTCVKTGMYEHYFCKNCSTYFDSDQQETTAEKLEIAVDPEAHDYGQLIEKVEPTCVKTGMYEHYFCKNCSTYFDSDQQETTAEKLEIAVDPEAHDYGQLIEKTEPNCTESGTEAHYQCTLCQKYFDEDHQEKLLESLTTPATGHSYDNHNKCTVCDSELQYTKDLRYTLINGNKEYEVSGIGSSSATDIIIPNYYNELPVTSIGMRAFYNCYSLTSITIPESVTSIESYAFRDCTSLKSVYITDLKAWCNIEFGNESANPLYYANNLYLNNNLVTEITADMLQGVTEIKAYAFYDCSSLASITIPDSVTSIGRYAFYNCTSLASITIPDSVTSIGSYAFYNCTSLTNITIPDSVTSIGNYAFEDCTNLTTITIGNSVASIGDDAFSGCANLTSITIPESITSIGDDAFNRCTSLETIYWNATNCKTTGFRACSTLTTVHIGENVKSIPNDAFGDCTNLTSVYISNIAAWCNIEFGDYNANPLYRAHNLYLNDELVTEITADMLQEVTSIPVYAFSCKSLTSINIPDSVTSIGNGAFEDCTNLKSINIPYSVTSIGDYAFSGCTNLTSITIPESITFIGAEAFSDCPSLTSIIVDENNSVYSSQDGILYNKDKTEIIKVPQTKTLVIIPDSVTSIGDYAFSGCVNLTNITIPDSVTSIGGSAFQNCRKLESVNFGTNSNLKSIGGGAFYNCTNITNIIIPDSVTSIGGSAFYNCRKLESVNFKNDSKLKSIDIGAFYNCTNLTNITIPDSVTSIGKLAFYECTSLENVTFENTSGWKVSKYINMPYAQDVNVTDNAAQNATYLKSTYSDYFWQRYDN